MAWYDAIPVVGPAVGAVDDILGGKTSGGPNINVSPYTPQASSFQFANTLNKSPSQVNPYQKELFSNLQARMRGEAPSVAEQQLQRGLEQTRAQTASTVSSAGGYDPALARAALYSQAAAGQEAAGQGALLRAQEQAQAEQLFAQALGQQRGQDIQERLGLEQLGLGAANIEAQLQKAYEDAMLRKYIAELQAQTAASEGAAGRQQNLIGSLFQGGATLGAGLLTSGLFGENPKTA